MSGPEGADEPDRPGGAAGGDAATGPGGQRSEVSGFFDASEGWRGSFYRDAGDPFGQMLVRRKGHVLRLFRAHVRDGAAAIFDAGCGPGEYLSEIGGGAATVVGMDASVEMLRSSAALLKTKGWRTSPSLVRGDIERIPLRSGSFDAILCIGVLGYLRSDAPALAELRRLLRPGGHLLLNVRNLNALTSLHYSARLRLKRLLREGPGAAAGAVSFVTHTRGGGWTSRAYNIGNLERLLASSGFERVAGETFGYELKALRLIGLGGRRIAAMEAALERMMMRVPVRPFRNAGWGYIGVFRRTEGAGPASGGGRLRSGSPPR